MSVPSPTMTSSDAKTAEFARLFDFFERLASRRARSSDSMDDLRSLPIPEELEPVIKSLSTIVGTSKASCRNPDSRPRRNSTERTSAADSDDDSDEDEDDESLAKFPLGKKYPFTFKLMVHKLYRVDEWAKTVKEMLEKSKMEFKSLAEQEAVVEAKKKQDDVAWVDKNTVHFKVGASNGGGRRGSVGGRQRSQSVVVLGPKIVGRTSPLLKSPGSGGQSEFRALKKRCVGRRRSIGGPINGECVSGRISDGSWVYDAAISSAEPASTTFPAFPSAPPPSPTASYRPFSQLAVGAPPIGGNTKRTVSLGMQKTLSLQPFQQVTNINPADRISARKRALTVDRRVEETQQRQMKRPFLG